MRLACSSETHALCSVCLPSTYVVACTTPHVRLCFCRFCICILCKYDAVLCKDSSCAGRCGRVLPTSRHFVPAFFVARAALSSTRHERGAVECSCARVLLRAGHVVQQGRVHDLLQRPADPFVTAFINAQRQEFGAA